MILLGGLSGVIATAFTSNALSDYAVQLNEQTRPILSTDRAPRSFPNSYADAMNHFVDSSLPSVVTIFDKSKVGVYGYTSDAVVIPGVAVTADGWIAVGYSPNLPAERLAVGVKNDVHDVTGEVTDPVTGIVFLKIQTSDLPVVGFGKAFDLTLGQQIFEVTHEFGYVQSLVNASVRAQEWHQGDVVSSDVPSRRIPIFPITVEHGVPTFDLSGTFIGFAQSGDDISHPDTSIVPVEDILPALSSLLEKKQIIRPSLGVQYIDISHAVGLPEKFLRGHDAGAYLTGKPAVKKGSAAATAGLNEGDIILAVNGQNIDDAHGLDEYLLAYLPGDKMTLAIDRLGDKQTVQVVLGEYGK